MTDELFLEKKTSLVFFSPDFSRNAGEKKPNFWI